MRLGRRTRVVAAAAVVLVAALASAAASSAARPLVTGIFDPATFASPDAAAAFARTRAAGASSVRLTASWAAIAPAKRAASFHASDPDDPAYRWTALDRQVKEAVAAGLSPILDLVSAPTWAQTGPRTKGFGPVRPRVAELADFATALAQRYGGGTPGLPRVKAFQLWNEPNLKTNLMPQTATSAARWYRAALNAFTAAIHGVHPDDVSIGGGLAPYGPASSGDQLPATPLGVAPKTFMRTLLCVSKTGKQTCKAPVDVDVWSFHPYTWGGPTHHAYSDDDLAIGDIPEAEAMLRDAVRQGTLHAHGRLRFWVTEVGWDSDPPDPKAIPVSLQARWTSQALYELWRDHVDLVTWFLLRDQPLKTSPFQSGLYYAGSTLSLDRPKPTLRAFRFPFVALQHGDGYDLWGRTPDSDAHTVAIEERSGSSWKRVATLHARATGIFTGRLDTSRRTGSLRARVVGGSDTSLPFGLKSVPDRRINPFGE